MFTLLMGWDLYVCPQPKVQCLNSASCCLGIQRKVTDSNAVYTIIVIIDLILSSLLLDIMVMVVIIMVLLVGGPQGKFNRMKTKIMV